MRQKLYTVSTYKDYMPIEVHYFTTKESAEDYHKNTFKIGSNQRVGYTFIKDTPFGKKWCCETYPNRLVNETETLKDWYLKTF